VSRDIYPASRGPSIFLDKSTYLGRWKGLCSQGKRHCNNRNLNSDDGDGDDDDNSYSKFDRDYIMAHFAVLITYLS